MGKSGKLFFLALMFSVCLPLAGFAEDIVYDGTDPSLLDSNDDLYPRQGANDNKVTVDYDATTPGIIHPYDVYGGKGQDGQDGQNGQDGQAPGEAGMDGTDGTNAEGPVATLWS